MTITPVFSNAGCDYAWEARREGVMRITVQGEAKHEVIRGEVAFKCLQESELGGKTGQGSVANYKQASRWL
jgi:hypothetical protein